MQAVLLDTDVFSFLFKADSRGPLYAPDVVGRQPCLSFQSVAELRAWAILRNWGRRRRERLDKVLGKYVVLPYDSRMADRWAEVTAHCRRAGRQVSCGDAWIAAAALRHDLALLTHNASHYAGVPGLKIISHSVPPDPQRRRSQRPPGQARHRETDE